MARITQAQLEYAVGGARVLNELLDFDGDGVADAGLVAQILAEADGEANSYISLAVDITDPAVATSQHLLRRELDIAVYLAWLRGTQAQAMPPATLQAKEDALRWFGDVRDRRAGLGISPRAAASQPVQQVTKADTEDWFNPAGPRARFNGGFA